MKIIEVNKFYYRRGGAESYLLDIEKKLQSEGHQVAIFSMKHPKNSPSVWEKYFVSRLSFNEGSLLDKIRYPFRLFYSFEAKRKFEKLVKDFQPDVIHIHNIYHQISPSILPVAKKYGIPVYMHLHDYKLICPNYQLFNKGEICYDCAAPNYFRCIPKRCVNNSLPRSIGATLEMWFHHSILKIYEKNVDCYIAPSKCMKDICVRFGVPEKKIVVLYNFIFTSENFVSIKETNIKSYLGYIGRLSDEKGIDILLQALALVDENIILKIAGEGPARVTLEKLRDDLGLNKRVEFMGKLSGSSLDDFSSQMTTMIIPSIWLENMPFSVLEALSKGKIVIASNIGGLPELITDQKNGFLFEPGNPQDLAKIISGLPQIDIEKVSQEAKNSVASFNIDQHYQSLLKIFCLYVK